MRRSRGEVHSFTSQYEVVFNVCAARACRWTENIAQKVKGKKKVQPDDSRKEILRSVFDPPVPVRPAPPGPVCAIYVASGVSPCQADITGLLQIKTLDHGSPMTQSEYDGYAQRCL